MSLVEQKKVIRTLQGVVISDKMDKTVIVKVERTFQHTQYCKVVRTSKKYKVHDEKSECKVGDLVLIQETRPLSKTKHMALHSILKS